MLAVFALADGAGVRLWLDGGWGVDALLGGQSRDHGDLDVAVEARHLDALVDADGNGVLGPASAGSAYPAAALAGRGRLGGRAVDCVSPEWAVRFHDRYPGDAHDRSDVLALCERFGLEIPAQYR